MTLGLLMFLAVAPEVATDVPPARGYTNGSLSVIGSASFGLGLFGNSQAGTGFQAMGVTGGVAVRWVTKVGFTLEPRLGIDGMFATGASGIYAVLAPHLGIGAGWAIPLGARVALTPMVSYEAMFLGGGLSSNLSGLANIGSVELPLTVFFGKNAFVEVFLRGGAMSMLGEAVPVFTAGYRFGMVW